MNPDDDHKRIPPNPLQIEKTLERIRAIIGKAHSEDDHPQLF